MGKKQETKIKKRTGFALPPIERRREVSRMGGIASHKLGAGHEFTSEESRKYARMGGLASQKKRREGVKKIS